MQQVVDEEEQHVPHPPVADTCYEEVALVVVPPVVDSFQEEALSVPVTVPDIAVGLTGTSDLTRNSDATCASPFEVDCASTVTTCQPCASLPTASESHTDAGLDVSTSAESDCSTCNGGHGRDPETAWKVGCMTTRHCIYAEQRAPPLQTQHVRCPCIPAADHQLQHKHRIASDVCLWNGPHSREM